MDVTTYQKIADHMLTKHYGLENSAGDLRLENTNFVSQLIKDGVRPFQIINEHAEECDLYRMDIKGFYGAPVNKPLTENDEDCAKEEVENILANVEKTSTQTPARKNADAVFMNSLQPRNDDAAYPWPQP